MRVDRGKRRRVTGTLAVAAIGLVLVLRDAPAGEPGSPPAKEAGAAPAAKSAPAGKPPPKSEPPPAPSKEPAQAGLPPLAIAHWINSPPLDLAQLKGKVVLVHFWGIVNGPSRALLPRFRALHEKHQAEGLVILGITEDAKDAVEAFAKAQKILYPLAIDDKGATHTAYAVEFLPTVWLIGRDGRVAWRGYAEKFAVEPVLDELRRK